MKKYIFTIVIFLFFYSCKSYKYEKFDYNHSENPWINKFKDDMFISCLKESYKNDTIFTLIDKKDALNTYDGLNPENEEFAKELEKNLIKNIPPPLMCENCKNGENYYMSNCLHYYKSKELDSIAQKLYQQKIKEEKKIWGKDYKN